MIEAKSLTKRYGNKSAVSNINFVVRPGTVTGLLGPNGGGKSTTMRMIVGLDRPSGVSVPVNAKRYANQRTPSGRPADSPGSTRRAWHGYGCLHDVLPPRGRTPDFARLLPLATVALVKHDM